MVQPLSLDIRKRMAKAVDGGSSRNALAKLFDVVPSTVIKLMTHIKVTDSPAPKKIGGYRKPKLAAHDAVVRDLVQAIPDATLDEYVVELADFGSLQAGLGWIAILVSSVGVLKKHCTQPSKTDQTSKPRVRYGARNNRLWRLTASPSSTSLDLPPKWYEDLAVAP